MQKKICPNGHVYDPSIYGDQCPMCPSGASTSTIGGTQVDVGPYPPGPMPGPMPGPSPFIDNNHTHIATPSPSPSPRPDVAGPTIVKQNVTQGVNQPVGGGHTVIRRPGVRGGASPEASGRKLVGFLVTYNRDPLGKAFNIYEGRNYIGRDSSCDICIADDTQMSGKHMSILYRNVDNKFKFRDEQSSNGTFVNKELLDEGELQNYDIVRVGSTLFIFIAIPKIG